MDPEQARPQYLKTKDNLDKVSSSFCIAKWYQATLHLHNGNTQSCHHVKSHKVPLKDVRKNSEALHNSEKKRRARQQMLSGERPKECDYCWKMEDRGQVSDRWLKSSEPWAEPHLEELLKDPLSTHIPPRHLEVAFDNRCNFKCMYCSPVFSSRWMEEIKRFGAYPTHRKFNNLWQMRWDKNLPRPEKQRQEYVKAFFEWWPKISKEIYFLNITGGEPLMIPETFQLLQLIEKRPCPDLHLGINTNLGVGRGALNQFLHHLHRLQGCVKGFTLFTSVDSVGAQADYIRYGLNFDRFMSSCHHVLNSAPNPFEFSLMITVNALSLPGLKPLMQSFLMLRRQYPKQRLSFAAPFLRYPAHLSFEILPKHFVSYIDDTLAWMRAQVGDDMGFHDLEITQIERLKTLLLDPGFDSKKITQLRKDFYRHILENDRRRHLDFVSVFPEYREFYEACSQI